VRDEVLAGLAPLVGVALAGEDERPLDRALVEVVATRAVLADDGEQIAEQDAILGGEPARDLVLGDDGAVDRVIGPDPRVTGGRDDVPIAVGVL
jgi:hypothetical protein